MNKNVLITFILCCVLGTVYNQTTVCNKPAEQEQTLAQKNTPLIISFFQTMVAENVIGIAHLKQLQVVRELINPIMPEERGLFTILPWAKQLDLFIQMKLPVDMTQINKWATQKIAELERAEETRKQVHEDTREIHQPMRFITIPQGKYINEITHEAFEIPEGIEIQDAPVTQWQWVQVLGRNPSMFVDGLDSEEVIAEGKKIKMRSNAPVEHLDWYDVENFLNALNKQGS